jgi:hypothetical protein
MTRIRFFGVAAYELTTSEGKKILVDPFLDENPGSPIRSAELGRVDLVVFSHAACLWRIDMVTDSAAGCAAKVSLLSLCECTRWCYELKQGTVLACSLPKFTPGNRKEES